MTTYGRFQRRDYEARQGNPYFEQSGQWYRISEVYFPQGIPDQVNYQAEECDAREPGLWQAKQEADAYLAARDVEVARAREAELAAKSAEYHRQVGGRPPLYEWAKTQGYSGRGRVSNELKRKYAEQFKPLADDE